MPSTGLRIVTVTAGFGEESLRGNQPYLGAYVSSGPPPNIVCAERGPLTRVSAYHGTLDARRVEEHEQPEIQFVVGLGTDTVEAAWLDEYGRRGRGPLRHGDIAIIASGQPHTFAWRAPAQLSCVYVDPRHFDGMIGGAGGGAIAPCFGLNDPLARELVIALAREALDGRASRRLLTVALEQSPLLGALGRGRSQRVGNSARPGLAPRRLAQVIEYVEAHLPRHRLGRTCPDGRHEPIALRSPVQGGEMAGAVPLPAGSPHRGGKAPAGHGAAAGGRRGAMGFAGRSHFGARFRAAVGMAPGAYRRAGPIPGRKIAPDRSTRS